MHDKVFVFFGGGLLFYFVLHENILDLKSDVFCKSKDSTILQTFSMIMFSLKFMFIKQSKKNLLNNNKISE